MTRFDPEMSEARQRSVQSGDDVAAATDLLNFALDRVAELTAALQRYSDARFEEAPMTSSYITELVNGLDHSVLAWIRRWPE